MELHLDWGIDWYLFNVTRSSSRAALRANNWLLSESSRGLKSAAPVALNEHQNKTSLVQWDAVHACHMKTECQECLRILVLFLYPYDVTVFNLTPPFPQAGNQKYVNTVKIWSIGQTSDRRLNSSVAQGCLVLHCVLSRINWAWTLGKLRLLSN